MCCMEMKRLFNVWKYPVYFAGKHFKYRGFYIWTGKDNVRIIPFNKFTNWIGKEND